MFREGGVATTEVPPGYELIASELLETLRDNLMLYKENYLRMEKDLLLARQEIAELEQYRGMHRRSVAAGETINEPEDKPPAKSGEPSP